jgi:hypothetical protein
MQSVTNVNCLYNTTCRTRKATFTLAKLIYHLLDCDYDRLQQQRRYRHRLQPGLGQDGAGGTSCYRRGGRVPLRCRPPHRKTVHRLVSVGSDHADVAILAVRSRPGISKKLTTEEENEGRRIILFHHVHHLNISCSR